MKAEEFAIGNASECVYPVGAAGPQGHCLAVDVGASRPHSFPCKSEDIITIENLPLYTARRIC